MDETRSIIAKCLLCTLLQTFRPDTTLQSCASIFLGMYLTPSHSHNSIENRFESIYHSSVSNVFENRLLHTPPFSHLLAHPNVFARKTSINLQSQWSNSSAQRQKFSVPADNNSRKMSESCICHFHRTPNLHSHRWTAHNIFVADFLS